MYLRYAPCHVTRVQSCLSVADLLRRRVTAVASPAVVRQIEASATVRRVLCIPRHAHLESLGMAVGPARCCRSHDAAPAPTIVVRHRGLPPHVLPRVLREGATEGTLPVLLVLVGGGGTVPPGYR